MAHRVSGPLARRRAKVALAIVVLVGAVTAVAVANAALLDVAGGAENQVGGLSARLDNAQPPPIAPGSKPVTGATAGAPAGATTGVTTGAATVPARTTATEPEPEPDGAATSDADHGEDSHHSDD